MGGTPILDAKITVPPLHRHIVERPAAIATLDRGRRTGVTLVAAAPGYLKRQLVASWAHRTARVAWLSLDDADHPARLLAHAVASIRRVVPGFAPDLDPGAMIIDPEWEAAAFDRVVEALGRETSPITAVIDSLHSLVDPVARRGIEMLVRYRPDPLRIVALTRDDAAIDLSGSGLDGSLIELREDALAFDADQTAEAVASVGRRWSRQRTDALHAATAGWPAGVYLTAARPSSDGRPVAFAAGDEPVRSYLRHRILDPLPSELRTFLVQVAPLRDVSVELCEHMTGRVDAGQALDRLVELHLLAADESRTSWFRFPAHVAAFAHHVLRSRDSEEARTTYHRAARWCWEHELLDESMRIAASGGDTELMSQILLEHHHVWSAGGQAKEVRRWTQVLLQSDPTMVEAQLASAWASLFLGDDAFALSTIALIAALDVSGPRGTFVRAELAMIRAHVSRRQGLMGRSRRDVQEAIDAFHSLPSGFRTAYRGALPGTASLHLGLAAVWAGALAEGVTHLDAAQPETGWAPRALPAIHGHLAVAHWLLDEAAATAHAEVALTHIADGPFGPSDFVGLCMGLILAVGPADGKQEQLDHVLALADAMDEPVAHALSLTAEIFHVATTDRNRALRALRRLRVVVDACAEPGALTAVCLRAAELVGVDGESSAGEPLTDGEERVLRMLSGSLTEREIAAELNLSHNTVRTYRRRLYKKLGVSSRSEASRALRTRTGGRPGTARP